MKGSSKNFTIVDDAANGVHLLGEKAIDFVGPSTVVRTVDIPSDNVIIFSAMPICARNVQSAGFFPENLGLPRWCQDYLCNGR